MRIAADLRGMSDNLPEVFKSDLSADHKKQLEFEFHSADYNLMMEVLTGFKTVIGFLIKELSEGEKNFEDQTIGEFMLTNNLYKQRGDHKKVLKEIGIRSASNDNLDILANLPLTASYSCLIHFFQWVDEGFYDFCALPYNLKIHLDPQDKKTIETLYISSYDMQTLLTKVQQLVDILKRLEYEMKEELDVS